MVRFVTLFFGLIFCECSTPDYITPDGQNILSGLDCNKVIFVQGLEIMCAMIGRRINISRLGFDRITSLALGLRRSQSL